MIDIKRSFITNLVVTPPLPLSYHSVYNVRRNANIPNSSHLLAWHLIYTCPLFLVYSYSDHYNVVLEGDLILT